MTTPVGATYRVSPRILYSFILEDYATPTPNQLDLTELLGDKPLAISQVTDLRYSKAAAQSTASYGGETRQVITLSTSLVVPTYDPVDLEEQVRELNDFMDAAPLREVRIYWIDDAIAGTDYTAYLDRCHLTELSVVRGVGLPNGAGTANVIPEMALTFVSMSDSFEYFTSADPPPAAPALYGAAQWRCATNDGSPALSIINDVTDETILVVTDQGKIMVRDAFEDYATL